MKQSYLVIYEKVAEDNWGGWAQDVPGAVGAGDSLEEARSSLLEGLDAMLEDLADRGLALPISTSKTIDLSAFDPDPAKSQYFVEWLTVNVPESLIPLEPGSRQAA